MVVQQKSIEHAVLRAGKITGSRFKTVMYGTMQGWAGLSKALYAEEADPSKFTEESSVPSLMHGTKNEPLAIATYELIRMVDIERPAFIPHPLYNFIGYSPDGRVSGVKGLVEVKCPFNEIIHLQSEFEVPKEHMPQMQGGIWCDEAEWCDFISFDPRQPEGKRIFIHCVRRDDDFIEKLRVRCLDFWEYHTTQQEPVVDLDRLQDLKF